jgi:hypothetical protein
MLVAYPPCRVATCVTTLLHTFGYVIDNNVCYRITTYVIDIIDVVTTKLIDIVTT